MFKLLRATHRGSKVANAVSSTTMAVVNGLLQAGADVRVSDNAVIVQETYAFYVTMSFAGWMNDLHRGQLLVHAADTLREWFEKVSMTNAADNQHSDLNSFTDNLVSYAKTWLEETVAENPNLSGLDEFHTPAVERLVGRLGEYLADRFPEVEPEVIEGLLEGVSQRAVNFRP